MIDELIERVEKGEGADRELDGMVAAAMLQPQRNGWKPWACPGGYVLTETGDKPRPGMGQFIPASSYTTSLDAVLALIEEKLPGAAFVVHGPDDGWFFGGIGPCLGEAWGDDCSATSPARALLAAALRALKESRHVG